MRFTIVYSFVKNNESSFEVSGVRRIKIQSFFALQVKKLNIKELFSSLIKQKVTMYIKIIHT